MKRLAALGAIILILFSGCSARNIPAQIAATTLPVYELTTRLTEGTGITVTRMVTENVSCLHDYSLNVAQVKAAEAAELIVISGAGLEEFMEDILHDKESVIDSSSGIEILECEHDHDHAHEHELDHDHHHETDSHIWLSPENMKIMASNICDGLKQQYPAHTDTFERNLEPLLAQLDALQAYGEQALSDLACRQIITFHDGFGYLAHSFGLTILEAVEEESGSEASAQELKHLITLVREHGLPAVFTERSGSVSAAEVIARETGAVTAALDMAMSGESWFDAMYHNIDTLKEALS